MGALQNVILQRAPARFLSIILPTSAFAKGLFHSLSAIAETLFDSLFRPLTNPQHGGGCYAKLLRNLFCRAVMHIIFLNDQSLAVGQFILQNQWQDLFFAFKQRVIMYTFHYDNIPFRNNARAAETTPGSVDIPLKAA